MSLKSPDPQASILLFNWQAGWTALVAIAVEVMALVWYLTSVRRLAAAGRHWSPWRMGSFVIGIAVVAYAAEGGIAYYDKSNFTLQVIQHLLLVDFAPPLLAIGAPLTLALQSSTPRTAAVLSEVLHGGAARLLTHPVIAFGVAMGSMYVYFLTPFYAWSAAHPFLHAYVELHFLVVGFLLWSLIVGKDALPRRLAFGARFVLVFVSVPFIAVLGLALTNATQPLYRAGNTLADTRAGGAVLLGLGEVLTVAVVAALFVQWAREEERRAVLADRQLDAALAATRGVGVPSPPGSDPAQ